MTNKTRSFKITSEVESYIWWRVRIYDDVASLHKAAQKYKPSHVFDKNMIACCQPVGFYNDALTGAIEPPPFKLGGVIRIVRPVSHAVIVHELLHAAIATYRMTLDNDVCLGDNVTQREEQLAYILTHLTDDFFRQY